MMEEMAMKRCALCLVFTLLGCGVRPQPPFQPARALAAAPAPGIAWPPGLPVYDHVVIVVEENKDFEQIIGSPDAPYINDTLRKEGASLTRMFAEEHHSQGNYFWLFSGSNQQVGFNDRIPTVQFTASNLGVRLTGAKPERTFKGYSEDLPKIGSTVSGSGLYARKHVPWISFSNVPNGTSVETSANLRFADFPAKFSDLPTVAFVIPNLVNDMHNGSLKGSIQAGDRWLRKNMNDYYQWAKQNNSLLIVTFDESDHGSTGLTDPAAPRTVDRNRIATILAGARIKPGDYAEKKGVTHVNLLRTLEAMYGLPQSGSQQPLAEKAGIADGFILTDIFSPEQPGPAVH
jgi:phosphatidylinositol-3-phosphatase